MKFILTETEDMKADFDIAKKAIQNLIDKYGMKSADEKPKLHTVVQWQIDHKEIGKSMLEITQYGS
jgi:hypothetical protein